jgi:hypothetical protein
VHGVEQKLILSHALLCLSFFLAEQKEGLSWSGHLDSPPMHAFSAAFDCFLVLDFTANIYPNLPMTGYGSKYTVPYATGFGC